MSREIIIWDLVSQRTSIVDETYTYLCLKRVICNTYVTGSIKNYIIFNKIMSHIFCQYNQTLNISCSPLKSYRTFKTILRYAHTFQLGILLQIQFSLHKTSIKKNFYHNFVANLLVFLIFFPSYIEVVLLATSLHYLRESDKKEREVSRTRCLFVHRITGKSICSIKCICHHQNHSRTDVLSVFLEKESPKQKQKGIQLLRS